MINFSHKKVKQMLKQSSNKIKKMLAILLIIIFVVSVTVAAVEARRGDGSHKGHGERLR